MKKTTAIISAAALSATFFTHVTLSEETAPDQKNRPDLRKLDKDGDHAISREEAGPQIWERLGQLDKNGDGKIAGDEFPRPGGGGTPGPDGKGKGMAGEFMKRADKNGDGNISKDEVPAEAWERLSKLDKDGDGSITKLEFAAAARERMSGGDFFANADKNKDGKLTESEIPQMWERMSKADRDNDGALSKEELAAAQTFMERGKGEGMPGMGSSGPGGPEAIFGKYDADKDEKLSKEEVPAEMWGKLSNADENADGLISKEELGNVYKKMQTMNPSADKPERPKRPEIEKTDA